MTIRSLSQVLQLFVPGINSLVEISFVLVSSAATLLLFCLDGEYLNDIGGTLDNLLIQTNQVWGPANVVGRCKGGPLVTATVVAFLQGRLHIG